MPKVTQQAPNGTSTVDPALAAGVASAWDLGDWIHMILYGDSGTGKTTIWATFPGPILALVCSGSGIPGEFKSIDTPANRKKIHAPVITRFGQVEEELDKARGKYRTVVLDHLTGLQDVDLREVTGREVSLIKEWGAASGDHYTESNRHMIEILRKFLDMPLNVVIVSQERTFTAKEDGVPTGVLRPTIGPAANPGVIRWLRPTADYIVQTFVRPKMKTTLQTIVEGADPIPVEEREKGVEFCLRCEPHDFFITKFRRVHSLSSPLPDAIVDANYDKIRKVIKGEPVS